MLDAAHAALDGARDRLGGVGVRQHVGVARGGLVDDAAAKLMAERGVYAVPTLVTYEALASEGERLGLLPESVAKIANVREAGLRSLEIYKKAGVKMGFGTDLLGESHRMQSDEFVIRARVMSNADVLRSATVVGAEIVGMAGRLGQLVPAAFADLLMVDGNPLADLSCLTGQGERIALVMKAGRVCFSTLS